ncbi:hypothetical protein GN956_G7938 [Arapaima gigas]
MVHMEASPWMNECRSAAPPPPSPTNEDHSYSRLFYSLFHCSKKALEEKHRVDLCTVFLCQCSSGKSYQAA